MEYENCDSKTEVNVYGDELVTDIAGEDVEDMVHRGDIVLFEVPYGVFFVVTGSGTLKFCNYVSENSYLCIN